jgi:hypothetical protein
MPVNLLSSGGGTTTLTNAASASNFTLTLPASTGTILTTTSPKAGNVLQVIQTVSSAQTAYSSASFLTIDELTTSITPTSSSSKILIVVSMMVGIGANAYAFAKFQRNGADIAGAKGSPTASSPTAATFEMLFNTNSGSQSQHAYPNNFMYLDSPATTSSTSYSIVANGQQTGAVTFYLNRAVGPNGDANNISGISTMTLMEIAG